MAFTELIYDRLWTNRSDFDTYVEGEDKVREDFQYHPNAVQRYINNVLLKELEGSNGAANIGDTYSGTVDGTIRQIKTELAEQARAIEDLALGEDPDSVRAAMVLIGENGWKYDAADHSYVLRMAQGLHKRKDSDFGYKLDTWWEGKYITNAWCLLTTSVRYEDSTGDMILTSETPYSGRIVFFGI